MTRELEAFLTVTYSPDLSQKYFALHFILSAVLKSSRYTKISKFIEIKKNNGGIYNLPEK